ncbi:MAG TPA: hypothetical protein EYP56_04100 [Planctomycetaceae bacterium]|nr:hypothetical protein [Planctomycetaceae bacterium]
MGLKWVALLPYGSGSSALKTQTANQRDHEATIPKETPTLQSKRNRFSIGGSSQTEKGESQRLERVEAEAARLRQEARQGAVEVAFALLVRRRKPRHRRRAPCWLRWRK